MSANQIQNKTLHYDGQAFIARIVEVLNRNDIRCYDSAIVQYIKTMSSAEFKECGINTWRSTTHE